MVAGSSPAGASQLMQNGPRRFAGGASKVHPGEFDSLAVHARAARSTLPTCYRASTDTAATWPRGWGVGMPDISADTIRAKVESLARKIERLHDALTTAQQEHAALLLTLGLFQPAAPKRTRRQTALDISLDELRGKSLDDALIYIAERNAGVLPSTAARGLLVEAGVLTGSQVGNALWNALDRSERFERESKGRYRLVDDLRDPVRLVS